jgi:ABC-type dipeptide/oligopeptide/nickel transport system permease component
MPSSAGTMRGYLGSLLAFALRRVLWTIPILFLVVTLLFVLLGVIGGDPTRHGQLRGLSNVAWVKTGDAKPESIDRNIRRELGLDRPWYERYGRFLASTATLDFGRTWSYRYRTVNDVIESQAPVSLQLGLLAFAWVIALGLPLGVLSAVWRGGAADGAARLAATLALALPNFLVGTLLIYLLGVRWQVFPTSGWDGWESKVLPSFTLGLLPAGFAARLVRTAMLETLAHDYVRAAAAKGLRRSRILVVHVLRNSLVPAVTVLGPLIGFLLTGSFVVEQVFDIPGIGRFYVAGVLARDFPLLLGLTVVVTTTIVLANLVVDLLHGALDPRVRDARA